MEIGELQLFCLALQNIVIRLNNLYHHRRRRRHHARTKGFTYILNTHA